jgi:hypothetical protein
LLVKICSGVIPPLVSVVNPSGNLGIFAPKLLTAKAPKAILFILLVVGHTIDDISLVLNASIPILFKLVKVDKFNSSAIALDSKAASPIDAILLLIGHTIDDILFS